MPVYDDDEESHGEAYSPRRDTRGRGGSGGEEWSVEDEGPDDRDLVPDEMTTVRCAHCRKLIFENLVRCPYCRQLQLEEPRERKPAWFVLTVIFCVLAVGGVSVLALLRLWPI
jgi:hypothetical protein